MVVSKGEQGRAGSSASSPDDLGGVNTTDQTHTQSGELKATATPLSDQSVYVRSRHQAQAENSRTTIKGAGAPQPIAPANMAAGLMMVQVNYLFRVIGESAVKTAQEDLQDAIFFLLASLPHKAPTSLDALLTAAGVVSHEGRMLAEIADYAYRQMPREQDVLELHERLKSTIENAGTFEPNPMGATADDNWADLIRRPRHVTSLQKATVDALIVAMREGRISDTDCVALLAAWVPS